MKYLEDVATSTAIAEAPPIIGLFETTLEVADLESAEHFYADILGLPVVERWGPERPAIWLDLGNENFLGLWTRQAGGETAIHQGRGGEHVHFALRVPLGTLDAFQLRLERLGIDVEDGWDFGNGNRAIYFDDPDGNVVELTERTTLWGGRPTRQ